MLTCLGSVWQKSVLFLLAAFPFLFCFLKNAVRFIISYFSRDVLKDFMHMHLPAAR